MPPTSLLTHDQILARTQAAVSATAYSSPATAVRITGHTRHAVNRMGDTGDLPTRQIGVEKRLFETTALLREAHAQGRLLLTDLLRTGSGDNLDAADLDSELRAHGGGTWYTVPRRGNRPPDWPSWHAWYRGARDQALAHLAEEQRHHRVEAGTLASRGLTRRHLWCPTLPLTDYGRYQQTRYGYLAEAGAQVQVVPGHRLTYAETQGALPDLEVLPGSVYVRRYTMLGARDGAIRITTPELVEATTEFVHWLYTTHATLLRRFTSPTSTRLPA